MRRLIPLLLLLLSAPGACDRNKGTADPEPTSSVAAPVAPAVPKKYVADETCRGQYSDLRIVGRVLNEKNEPQGNKPMLMTAGNLQGLGAILDADGTHVDQGYSNIVRSTYVMCLTVERKMNDPYTYHVKLTFRIQTNADGWKVECSMYDLAYGLGALDLAHGLPDSRGVIKTTGGKVVAAEATCERQFPPVK